MKESTLLAQIRGTLGRLPNVRVFRNGVGVLKDADGRHVRYGLCNGSADLIGWKTENGIARFVALEIKSGKGRLTPEQENFLRVVAEAGGYAGCARTVAEALAIIGETDEDQAALDAAMDRVYQR